MARSRDLFLSAVVAAGAAFAGVAAYRTAHVTLPHAVRIAIARALGVEPSGVLVGAVRLRATGLDLEQLTAGQLAVRHAELRPGLRTLLGGRATGRIVVDDLMIEDPPVSRVDRLRVGHGELDLGPDGARLHGQHVVIEPRSPHASLPDLTIRVAELGVELDRGHGRPTPRRIAFSGLALGPIDGLAGGVRAHDGGIEVRAAAPGVQLVAHSEDGAGEAELTLVHRALGARDARLLAPLGVTALEGTLSGTASVTWSKDGGPIAALKLLLPRGALEAPRLAPTAIRVDGLALDVRGHLGDGGAVLDTLVARLGALTITGRGAITTDEDGTELSLRVELPTSACADVLTAFPEAVRPALDGMGVTGELGGFMELSVPLDTPSAVALDGALALACHVEREPPLADAARLRAEAPLLTGARSHDGRPLRIELGPHNPSFRTLAQLPALVIDTFVEAEDGRFFRHPGLDLGQIRRALAHDLETGTPGRGGSTITQQVAKNLFLSGERTFGRKLEEAVLAWRLEERLGKRRILELYLNLIELGPGVYGVEDGAQHWFHKGVASLSADEVAMLAALLPAPRRGMDEAFQRRYTQLRGRLPGIIAQASQ